jgi:pyruvate dehydrogenase E2 component (dihydrolipoamide acetyltransferase)
MFVAVNASIKAPVVEGDKIVVGDVMNCNFAVDHRYIDGGKCKQLIPAFRHVFEHPEEYMDSHLKGRKAE